MCVTAQLLNPVNCTYNQNIRQRHILTALWIGYLCIMRFWCLSITIYQTMLWCHNARVNSHQRWKQTRFGVFLETNKHQNLMRLRCPIHFIEVHFHASCLKYIHSSVWGSSPLFCRFISPYNLQKLLIDMIYKYF